MTATLQLLRFAWLFLAFSLSVSAFSQPQSFHLLQGCAYDDDQAEKDLYLYDPSNEADRIVAEIVDALGLTKNFSVKASNVQNAMATTEGGKRYILYSTSFLEKFKADARTRWAAYAVLAHEIGHHLNGHDFGEKDMTKRKLAELEADRFSGSVLRMLGASLDEAQAGLETFPNEAETRTHPSKSARREAIANGWKKRDEWLRERNNGPVTAPDKDADGVPDSRDACPDTYGATSSGCPDADEDGIPDHDDRCPYEKGTRQNSGCPQPIVADRDKDGVPDAGDACPDQFGEKRFSGCPDSDGDGVPNNRDDCPTVAGLPAKNGCPEAPPVNNKMALIQGGTFEMGDLFGDGDADEKPTHKVQVSSFYLGKTEVTFDDYDAYCTATGANKPGDEGWGRGKRPVTNINWLDAVAYCNWLSVQEGLTPCYTIDKENVTCNWAANGYRLPTEAEWEYAARQGGQKVRFGNGKNTADPADINFECTQNYKEPYSLTGTYLGKSMPVKSFAPNSLGLYEMSGNVMEWCWDLYSADYFGSSPKVNPRGPDTGTGRVLKGGCWGYNPYSLRASCRKHYTQTLRARSFGIRLARSA